MGGERHGPDFQNLHRNKRSMTLNLKSPDGVAILKRLVRRRRRAGGELPPRREVPPRHRLCDAATGQSAAGLRQHLGLRPGRAVSRAPRLRPDRAGHGRADVDHRPARPGAGARRHPGGRPHRRHLLRDGHPGGAAGARAVRRGPVGAEQPARGADRHAGLPGGALDDRPRGAGPGRQRPSDQHPDRRVPDRRRLHEHRRRRRGDLSALLQGASMRRNSPPIRISPPTRIARGTAPG